MNAGETLTARREVWAALSELFLDTETDLPGILTRLQHSVQHSGYSRAQIEFILRAEVAPLVGGNVLSVAGVWDAFDLTPVEQRYLAGQARPSLLGNVALRVIHADWEQVRQGL